jgi:hypothetical protein
MGIVLIILSFMIKNYLCFIKVFIVKCKKEENSKIINVVENSKMVL